MHIRISKGPNQRIHSTSNWNSFIVLDKDYIIFKAIKSGKVVGQVGLELGDDFAYIFSLAVDPNFREAGLGSLLLSTVEHYAKKHAHDIVYLQVEKCNEKTLLPFYAKRHYKKNYKDELLDEWCLYKEL